jgi:hypothetical protein
MKNNMVNALPEEDTKITGGDLMSLSMMLGDKEVRINGVLYAVMLKVCPESLKERTLIKEDMVRVYEELTSWINSVTLVAEGDTFQDTLDRMRYVEYNLNMAIAIMDWVWTSDEASVVLA